MEGWQEKRDHDQGSLKLYPGGSSSSKTCVWLLTKFYSLSQFHPFSLHSLFPIQDTPLHLAFRSWTSLGCEFLAFPRFSDLDRVEDWSGIL